MSKNTVPVLSNIAVEIHDDIGKAGAAVSAIGSNGHRYHVWATSKEPLRRERVLYCNPPAGLNRGEPGFFETRRYDLGTRYKGMDAIADEMMRVAIRDGLLAKAREAFEAKQAAEAKERAQLQKDSRIREHGLELFAALKNLTEWGREHTSPRDANSPHDLLVAAQALIDKLEGPA